MSQKVTLYIDEQGKVYVQYLGEDEETALNVEGHKDFYKFNRLFKLGAHVQFLYFEWNGGFPVTQARYTSSGWAFSDTVGVVSKPI